jgi:diguanylate cyclase (GGDEF)-like protein
MAAAMDSDNTRDESRASALPSGHDVSLPWHLRLPRGLEREFAQYFRDTTRPVVTGSFYLILALFLAGTVLESLIINGALETTWRPRLLILIGFGAVFVVARSQNYNAWLQPVIAASVLVFCLSHDYMGVALEHRLDYFYFYMNGVAILLMGTLFRVMMVWALPVSLVVLGAEWITLILFSSQDRIDISAALLFTTTVGALSLFGQYFFERLQRRHFLSERVLSMHRTELHAANRMLENQVTEDSLTGTINRRGLEQRLEALFHARRQGDEEVEQLAMLLFDIDFFKQYNDTYGHQAGDTCLRTVASEAQAVIQRETDFVARYGGEEFLVVLVNGTLQDALVTAERIRARIEQRGMTHETSRAASVVTISVGVTAGRTGILEPQEMVRRADDALYEAKEAGRNRVACAEPEGPVRVLSG